MIKSKSYSISDSVRLQKSLTGIFSLSGKAVSKKVSSANLSSSESKYIIEAFVFNWYGGIVTNNHNLRKKEWRKKL